MVTAAVAAVVVTALVVMVVVPVCAPAKKTITGFSPNTHRLTHLKEYAIYLIIIYVPILDKQYCLVQLY